jgi:hypothetical protein
MAQAAAANRPRDRGQEEHCGEVGHCRHSREKINKCGTALSQENEFTDLEMSWPFAVPF